MARRPTTEDGRRRNAALRAAVCAYGREIRKDPGLNGGALLLPGLGNVLLLYVPPLIVAQVIAAFGADPQADPSVRDLTPHLVAFAATWFGGELLWRVGVHLLARGEVRAMERLYRDGLDALLAKDAAFFHDSFAGSLTSKVISYAKSFVHFLDTLAFSVASNLVPLVFAGVVLWRLSPLLPTLLLGWLVLTVALITPLIRRRKVFVDEREKAGNELTGHVADSIGNIDAVLVFARQEHEAAIHRRNIRRFSALALRSWDYQNKRIDVVTLTMYVLSNLTGVLLALHLSAGRPGGIQTVFVTFSFYAAVTRFMWDFNHIYRNLETTITEAAQFTELLLDDPDLVDPAEPLALTPADASVRFDHVRFRYKGAVEPLFDGLDLHVADGEKVGLVGRSGGGKSTITKLLLRLMDVQSGRILVGGQDISTLRQADVRSLIAYVPQDPAMFHRSLRDNIAFGRLDATEDDIRAAAHAAHAADFIESLPDGYDTLVGERGIKLSGGQRQRIAIARAIVRRAPILILDEATSSLDSESEAMIQLALAELMERTTAVVVAHRLSTLHLMDRLVVLDRGIVVEEGTHDRLVDAGGTYAALWARQSGGYLAEQLQP